MDGSVSSNMTYVYVTTDRMRPTSMRTAVSCWQEPTTECYHMWRDFRFYALSVIIPAGLIFNSVSFGVFMTSWMRRTIPGRYFMALALADNLVLIGELLKWLNTRDSDRGPKLGLSFLHTNRVLCQGINFLRYGSRMWSSWVTVAITVERFLTISFPFKKRSNPMKAVAVVVVEAVVCFSLACFPFFTLKPIMHGTSWLCGFMASSENTYHTWLLVAVACIGELVLPSVIVSVFTVLIIGKLLQAQRNRSKLSASELRTRWRQRQPTVALVFIAGIFVTVRMPYLIMFFVMNSFDTSGVERYKRFIAFVMAEVFAVLNYTVNFFIFCVSGNTFRCELAKCYPWRKLQEPCGNRQSSDRSAINMTDRTDLRKLSAASSFSSSLRKTLRGALLGETKREAEENSPKPNPKLNCHHGDADSACSPQDVAVVSEAEHAAPPSGCYNTSKNRIRNISISANDSTWL